MGLAGMGDHPDLHRRPVAQPPGSSRSLGKTRDILRDLGHVAGRVSTTREVSLARRLRVEMPICEAVDALLHHDLSARTVEQLLARAPPRIDGLPPSRRSWPRPPGGPPNPEP